MTATTTDDGPGAGTCSADAAGEAAHPAGYDERVAALTAAYHRTVDHIMTTRYGPAWASRGDLPDEAYTAETTFNRWLNDLLDHIDTSAASPAQTAGQCQRTRASREPA